MGDMRQSIVALISVRWQIRIEEEKKSILLTHHEDCDITRT